MTVMLLMVMLFTGNVAFATDYIKDVLLIGHDDEDQFNALQASLVQQGWIAINKDLNAGAGGDYIHLLYKKESTVNNLDWDYITDFRLSSYWSETINYQGRTYYPVPLQGSDDFLEDNGDLNNNAGGAVIFLYYTKDVFQDGRTVTGITFNDTQSGALGINGGSTGYDLNSSAGGDYIYMHFTTGTSTPIVSGKGTANNPYIIGSASNWNTFTVMIKDAQGQNKYYQLGGNIATVTTMAGTSSLPFNGTFDGNGHTITVNINSSETGTAPFHYINGATIKNLTVQGTVTSSAYHASGLAGSCGGTNTINNCTVLANINATGYGGGVVGHGGTSTLNFLNSNYGGTISGFTNYAGGVLGWCDGMTLNINNCQCSCSFVPSGNGKYHPIACKNGNSTVTVTAQSVFYSANITPTATAPYIIPGAEGVPVLQGLGLTDYPYLISTTNDWQAFTIMIQDEHLYNKCYQLLNDINVSTMAGTSAQPFGGTFDGNGHSITVTISTTEAGAAPFHYVNGATIKDLTVNGSVSSSARHASGLVGSCGGSNTITGCAVNANVNGAEYVGGMVGHGGTSTLNIIDSYYTGTISGFNHYAGGLLGWCDNMTLNLNNCLFKGSFSPASGGLYHPIACKNSVKTVQVSAENTYYLNDVTPTVTDDNVIQGAEGVAVSPTLIEGSWDLPVTAADGLTYYLYLSGKRLPYFYGFENYDLEAEGWINSSGISYLVNSTPAAHSGSCAFWLQDFSKEEYLRSPELDCRSAITVYFYAKSFNSQYRASFQVGYSQTGALDDFIWGNTITPPANYSRYEISAPKGTKYIAIKKFKPEDDYTSMFLDDFSFISEPSPVNLAVSNLTDHSAKVTWEAPETDLTITGYAYQYKKSSDANWSAEVTVGGNTTSVTLNNLTCLTTYQFRVKALYGNRESLYAECSFTTLTLSPPVNLYTSNLTDHSATVSWEAPDTNLTITGYTYQYKKSSDANWSSEETVDSNVTSAVVTNLSRSTQYQFRVKTLYGNRESLYAECSFTTLTSSPPVNLYTSNLTDHSATVSWEAPDTNLTLTGYTYQYKKKNDANWSSEVTVGINTTSVTLNNLTCLTTYQFRVKALYGNEESTYTNFSFITTSTLPYEYGFEDGINGWTQRNINVNNSVFNSGINEYACHTGNYGYRFMNYSSTTQGAQYLITPQFPGDPINMSFYYYVSSQTGGSFFVGYSLGGSNPEQDFTWVSEIQLNNSYHTWIKHEENFPADIRYIAIKFDNSSSAVIRRLYIDDFAFEENSTYAKPTDIIASSLTTHSATMTWTKPNNSVTGYKYQYKKQTDVNWSDEITTTSTSVTLNNLPSSTTYDFRVKALYGGNNASNYVYTTFITEGDTETPPIYQGFENGMGGWRAVTDNQKTGLYTGDYVHGGNRGFKFDYETDEFQYLISPLLESNSDLLVSFYYINFSNDIYSLISRFDVGYSTTTKDPDEFYWGDMIVSDYVWKRNQTIVPAGAKYVGIKWVAGLNLYIDDISVEPVVTQNVTGYGESTESDHWMFIASPVAGHVYPEDIGNLMSSTASNYDLYRFNQSAASEWENYKSHDFGFVLYNGNGYLYANKNDVTLYFVGELNNDASKTVNLVYSNNSPHADARGWNLVGNPFPAPAYSNKSYYKMNAAGSDIEAVTNTSTQIGVCQGVLVRATGTNQTVTFTKAGAKSGDQPESKGSIELTLTKGGTRGEDFHDKAIVSFDEGTQLSKYIFNEEHAKLYIPQGTEDYAIAFSNREGEVPVHFKTKEVGTYTITVVETHGRASLQGVHLIDLLANVDIDLGVENSYTFIGSPADRQARFKIVFKNIENDGNDIFAYQNGSDIIVSGEGELQIFDVVGRMVMNQHINGVETINKPSQSGVYILKLNEKTQKIVIR